MTRPDRRGPALEPRIADQVNHITSTFHHSGIEIGVVTSDRGVEFMYREGQLLVSEQHVGQVREILGQPDDHRLVDHVAPGVVLLTLGGRPPRRQQPPGKQPPGKPPSRKPPSRRRRPDPGTLDALDQIEERLGEGIATPDHLLTVAGVMGPCPATEPQEVYEGIEPYPSVCPGNGGAGVRIYISDTGLLTGAAASHPWLAGVTGEPDPNQPAVAGGTIPPYAGHGTFVAGVARCMAPGADIFVSNAFKVAGSALESDFVKDLKGALASGVDIFHLAVTAPTRKDLPLHAFRGWLKLLRQYKGVVCIAAAGNNGNELTCWPAGFRRVVSVGALAADWRSRAEFSNYGGWVDVYAPGRNLVNAYAAGPYTCQNAPYTGQVRHFHGMAKWSGTSFSTPIVTGLVAARMSRTGENGEQAAAALLAEARSQAIPGVGAILLPCCDNELPACLGHSCGCADHGRTCGCPGCGHTCGCRRL